MAPLIIELKKRKEFEVYICSTGQHKEMLDQVLDYFLIVPDFKLELMTHNQSLEKLTREILINITLILEKLAPDHVLVHGDTTTSFASALASFYASIPVSHVEAGLRTTNINEPFPEEMNRNFVDLISKYYFCPTHDSYENLMNEGKPLNRIFVTGNTIIDTFNYTLSENYNSKNVEWFGKSKKIVLTMHRRENFGDKMKEVFVAILDILEKYKDYKILFPVHKNPLVKDLAYNLLANNDRIKLVEPLEIKEFHNILNIADLILTDSGGIQEEATGLNKLAFVLRDVTERNEGVKSGNLVLVGTKRESILKNFDNYVKGYFSFNFLNDNNPYGNGLASKRIVEILLSKI